MPYVGTIDIRSLKTIHYIWWKLCNNQYGLFSANFDHPVPQLWDF